MIFEYETILNILSQIYIPANWAELMTATQDQSAMLAAVTSSCDVQKFFNTATALITAEGSSKLVSRFAGGIIFELPRFYNEFLDAATTQGSGKAIGKMVQLIFNYYI